MTSTPDEAPREGGGSAGGDDTAPHETPEVGLVADEELPEDLQPTDDNPLAKDPDDTDDEDTSGPGGSPEKVDGMPDMGDPA